jgi:hypothetical protein
MIIRNGDNNKQLSFSGAEAVDAKNKLFEYFKYVGLNPLDTAEWKKGIFRLLDIETVNLPNFSENNYILASNHISDFDAVILGLLCPGIRIISKIGWAANEELMGFLRLHYDIIGIYRDCDINALDDGKKKEARKHNYDVTIDALKYLKGAGKGRHLLIFPQGTISDVNNNSKERVNLGFVKMAFAAKVDVVNVFTEYPDIGGKTRVVCGTPYTVGDRNRDYRQDWLDSVVALQNLLSDVRKPNLSEKHAQNNNPGEPYF